MKFLIPPPTIWLLFALICFACFSSCKKNPVTIVNISRDAPKRTVIDYLLNDNSGNGISKYMIIYNGKYQVTEIYRGERFAAYQQMQVFARLYYNEAAATVPEQQLPDSVVFYNSKGKISEVVKDGFKPIEKADPNANYLWPERPNKILNVPGITALMAIAGKKVNWNGGGHLGSANSISAFHNLKMINKTSLSDFLTEYYQKHYTTDSIKTLIRYQEQGFPTDVIQNYLNQSQGAYDNIPAVIAGTIAHPSLLLKIVYKYL